MKYECLDLLFFRLLLDKARVKNRMVPESSVRPLDSSPGRGLQSPILGPLILRTIHLGAGGSGDKIFRNI